MERMEERGLALKELRRKTHLEKGNFDIR